MIFTYKSFGHTPLHSHQLEVTWCKEIVQHYLENWPSLECGLVEGLLKADVDHAQKIFQSEHQGGKELRWAHWRVGHPFFVELDLFPKNKKTFLNIMFPMLGTLALFNSVCRWVTRMKLCSVPSEGTNKLRDLEAIPIPFLETQTNLDSIPCLWSCSSL